MIGSLLNELFGVDVFAERHFFFFFFFSSIGVVFGVGGGGSGGWKIGCG